MIHERRNTSSSISGNPRAASGRRPPAAAARKKRREIPCSDLGRFPNEACPWAPDAEPPRWRALEDAVRDAVSSALTDKQRRAVEGYFFEGLSQGDLAKELGVTQQVVQKTLFGVVRGGKRIGGALSRLREVLAPLMDSTAPGLPTSQSLS